MSIRVAINHKTAYKFDRPVNLSPHVFRLRPAAHSRTSIDGYSFKIFPENHFLNWQQDPFGNWQARVVFPEKTTELRVEVEVIANMVVLNPFDFFVEDYAETFPFKYQGALIKELQPYLHINEAGPMLTQWVKEIDLSKPMLIVDFLVFINQKVNQAVNYSIRMEAGVQTAEETLTRRIGSCRDSAWLLVQFMRHLGLAARFVSGYLVQLTADVKSLDGPSGPEADFTDLHAWAEVFIPGAGWVGLDATSGLLAGEGHIPLACTPHFSSAAPVTGATDVCETTFEFDNSVTRIFETPRVTKPLTEDQWAQIDAIGYQVDAELEAGDVRLTMGGEPTFVSIDDMESAQWNTDADGPEKRALSHDLIFKLRHAFAQGGMLHYGMGKWYPGEPLPRWQYGLFWRKDGYPIWQNEQLIAHEKSGKNFSQKDAGLFMTELAKHLALDPKHISAAFEDAFYFIWTERKTPINLDPLAYNLKDGYERSTLSKLLNEGLSEPIGYVLPMRWNYDNSQWKSCAWEMRDGRLFLIPGNSPMGLRLPLDSLPHIKQVDEPQPVERSLFDDLPQLDTNHNHIAERYNTITKHPEPKAVKSATADEATVDIDASKWGVKATAIKVKKEEKELDKAVLYTVNTIKTAICVEARQGFIYVFLPPTVYIEHYLDLIASVEQTAEKLQMPVRIEGYEPPRDYRVERMVVSPDPGVIEVNIHPAKNWKELTSIIDTLYEQAHLSRLGTEKFMLDGKHTGTGGGNHITLGGATPSNSPLLRRPDLLQSFITFWQHHPALSYLFSGSFIGPTSQAPRIDEAREERLFEMEIAFSQVPDPKEASIPFWLVDRIFRHLLTDITGNTHRSEFCIDKLYSPDSSSGRLGILEFRAFDMPPHKQMSLLQMLLIRTLVAKFWKEPYNHDLVRWGTLLNDKFMLPHFLQQDMKEVVQYLNDGGYAFKLSWFDSFFEFRFPLYGQVKVLDIDMEIRMGLEPWHVLGEEMSSSGTSRFVDSSLERIQVKLSNLNGERYVLLCNGVRVPLKATSVKGEYVCGIRYRAWQPPSALHPTIGVDAPLVLDIVDTWNSRSIGGCTYYVAHPGGRNYDTFPINSMEAESRRVSRFWNMGHTPDVLVDAQAPQATQHFVTANTQAHKVDAPDIAISPEYPNTLDLRKFKARKKRK